MYKVQVCEGLIETTTGLKLQWRTIGEYDSPVKITHRITSGPAQRVIDPDGNEIDFVS